MHRINDEQAAAAAADFARGIEIHAETAEVLNKTDRQQTGAFTCAVDVVKIDAALALFDPAKFDALALELDPGEAVRRELALDPCDDIPRVPVDSIGDNGQTFRCVLCDGDFIG